MNKIIEFIGENYAWFLTITIILLFALIGYIYDSKKSQLKDNKEEIEDTQIDEIENTDKESLSEMVAESATLNVDAATDTSSIEEEPKDLDSDN